MNGRKRATLSKPLLVAVFRRDGWLCRWCEKPVIFAPVMRVLELELKTSGTNTGPVAYYHSHWTRAGAPLIDLLGAEVDHVEAHSAGGRDHIDNFATVCHKCNLRKGAGTHDQFLKRPREKPVKGKYGEPQSWDGLSSVFIMLAQRHRAALTAGEKGWLASLGS